MQWVPEVFPSTGGLAAAGFYKLLGKPRLDPLAVLVRETAQNSWDARQPNDEPVRYSLAGAELTDQQIATLRQDVFLDSPKVAGTGLATLLGRPSMTGLYISDRNTNGLGGPYSAALVDRGGAYNWVNFVLNVGKAKSGSHSGGTYGFGKTITYVVSRVNAVVIHTRTRYKGKIETRLIACAIGDEFDTGGRLFTGRHWWGRETDGHVEPVRGAAADRIAAAIGMPAFDADELGTNILVLDPDPGGRTPPQMMTFIAESVLWHLWPKLVAHNRILPMEVSVSWNGQTVPVADPADRPPLHGFVNAFVAILDRSTEHTRSTTELETIRCLSPKADVGDLATTGFAVRRRPDVDDGSDPDRPDGPQSAAPFTGDSHHVALLRTPELVVGYLEGPPPLEGGMEWAGVFRARDDHDKDFAEAEPPTHDTWNPSLMERSPRKTWVNVGLREIRRELDERWRPRAEALDPTEPASTALVANELSHLIGAVEAKGKGRRRQDGVSPSPTTGPRVQVLATGPVLIGEEVGTLARIQVTPQRGRRGTHLVVDVAAALDGTEPDENLDPTLALVEVRTQNTSREAEGTSYTMDLQHTVPQEVEILVRRSAETTVLFAFDAEGI